MFGKFGDLGAKFFLRLNRDLSSNCQKCETCGFYFKKADKYLNKGIIYFHPDQGKFMLDTESPFFTQTPNDLYYPYSSTEMIEINNALEILNDCCANNPEIANYIYSSLLGIECFKEDENEFY